MEGITMSELGHKLGRIAGIATASAVLTISILLLVLCWAFVQGFVLSTMWGWFVVPLGLPALGLAHAIGLSFLVRWLTHQHVSCQKDENRKEVAFRQLAIGFLYPFAILFLGWITTLFM